MPMELCRCTPDSPPDGHRPSYVPNRSDRRRAARAHRAARRRAAR